MSALLLRKGPGEIEMMRRAGTVVAAALEAAREAARPGASTLDLDAVVERVITAAGCVPSFKGYEGFPASICASLNDEVVHGIPRRRRVLREGDLVKVDVGAIHRGLHADSAISVYVGDPVPSDVEALLRATRDALWAGIACARAGRNVSDIGDAVERTAQSAGFSVVTEYTGHGIGSSLHEDPAVPNHGPPGRGPLLAAGVTIAIEPMVNAGGPETEVLRDGWTVVTADGSLSAHFEHTVAVTDGEPDVLTVA